MRHRVDEAVPLACRLLPREQRLIKQQLVAWQFALAHGTVYTGVVPKLEQSPLGLVVERVLFAHEFDHVSHLSVVGQWHRGERAIHEVDAQVLLREER